MPSTFFGLNIAYSGLNAAQAQINTTANNISNVDTKGYSKQKVNLVASSALRVYSRYGTTSTGVTADSITQDRDLYYDEKYWNNQAVLGQYDKKYYYMQQIEGYYSTTADTSSGFSAIYAKMFNGLDTVKTNAGATETRNEFISDAQEMMQYFNSIGTSLQQLQSSINDEIKTTVDNINAIAKKVALLNKQINTIEVEGGYANELRDQRALLVDELSEIVPVSVREVLVIDEKHPEMITGATRYSLKINGQILVDTYDFNTLDCVTREEKYNQSDIDGLYDVEWTGGGRFDPVSKSMDGQLKAMFEVRDGNNKGNLHGYVSSTETKSITITSPSCTDIREMNLPASGMLTVASTQYTYESFEINTDADGNIESYTFHMKQALDSDARDKMTGGYLEVGDAVDFMGIAYYQNQMNMFLRSFTKEFNDIEREGIDLYGNDMGSFFVANNDVTGGEYTLADDYKSTTLTAGKDTNSDYYYQLTALNCTVAKATREDPKKFSTSYAENYTAGIDKNDLVVNLLKLEKEKELFRGGGGDTFLQCIYSDVTVDTQECKVFTANYTNIREQIQAQRESISGVDEDEEALDLVKFQNAYNLASKCISVMNEIYQRLILQTGV